MDTFLKIFKIPSFMSLNLITLSNSAASAVTIRTNLSSSRYICHRSYFSNTTIPSTISTLTSWSAITFIYSAIILSSFFITVNLFLYNLFMHLLVPTPSNLLPVSPIVIPLIL